MVYGLFKPHSSVCRPRVMALNRALTSSHNGRALMTSDLENRDGRRQNPFQTIAWDYRKAWLDPSHSYIRASLC